MEHLPDYEELEFDTVMKHRKRSSGKKKFGVEIKVKYIFSDDTYTWIKKYRTAKSRDEALRRIQRKDRWWYLSVESVNLL